MIKRFINQKIFLFVIGTMAILFTSCSKDDEVTLTGPESELIGLWTISENNVTVDAFMGDQTIIDYLINVEGFPQGLAEELYLVYRNELLDDFDISGTIEFKTDNTYLSVFPPDDADEGTWKLSSDGKVLTLDEGDPVDEEVITVNSISSNSMSITINQIEYEDLDDNPDNADDEVTIAITITLSK